MGRRCSWLLAASLSVLAFAATTATPAVAAPKPKVQAAAKKGAKAKKADAEKDKDKADEAETEARSETEATDTPAPSDRKPEGAQEEKVKAAGSTSATKEIKADVKEVKTDKGDEGVKTYKFGTIEIEGRLKSPQIIYFLRRVRAEFEAGALGHRSFMRELSDTRRNPSFR